MLMLLRNGAATMRSAVLSLVVFIMLASAATATAQAEEADTESDAAAQVEVAESVGPDACWENIETAPFNDTADLSSESKAAIDCVYHYAITKGTSAVTFSPMLPVTRVQMALFLVRTSKILGLDVPEEANATFDDLELVSAEAKLAIAQLNELEIARGYSPQTFGPANRVSRAHMAHFLARLIRLTSVPLPPRGQHTFEDVALLSANAGNDISIVVALGVMEPIGTDRFDPHTAVTREHMALYLARILKIAKVDPVSLELSISLQSLRVGGAAVATIRASKPDGSPYTGLLIDVFADYGWRNDGACNLDTAAQLNGGDGGTSENCRIDVGDPRTDSNGEVTVGLAHNAESAANWIFAWTGTLGQVFDENEVTNEVKQKIDWQASPTSVTVTDPFGLVNEQHFTVYDQNFSFVARLVGPNSAQQPMVLVASVDDLVRVTRYGITNNDGEVAFSLPGLPAPSDDISRRRITEETIFVYWDRNANYIYDGPAELSASTTIYWS